MPEMSASLRYFTGTGNSWRVLDTCREILEKRGYSVTNRIITRPDAEPLKDSSLTGFCFPVYALGIPRIARNYLRSLNNTTPGTKAFIFVTGAHPKPGGNCGWALVESRKILESKGYHVAYTELFVMPDNYLPFDEILSHDEAAAVNAIAEKEVRDHMEKILCGEEYHKPLDLHVFGPLLSRITRFAFHKIGIRRAWQMFNSTKECSSCGICEKYCPVKAVRLVKGRPQWNRACEQCMRCINYCPEKAIRQFWLGKNKNRYHEPHFKPAENS